MPEILRYEYSDTEKDSIMYWCKDKYEQDPTSMQT